MGKVTKKGMRSSKPHIKKSEMQGDLPLKGGVVNASSAE